MVTTYYERNLPHWQPEGRTIFLTWRLHGSLPRGFVHQLRKFQPKPGKQFMTADLRLDAAATGPRWLGNPEDRRVRPSRHSSRRGTRSIRPARLRRDAQPRTHLADALAPLRRITAGIKGASARAANKALARTGKPFWQDESFDHWILSSAQFEKVRAYIEDNPVRAGLVAKPEHWQWSSAHK